MTEGRDKQTGRFAPGNRFWEARSSAGPKPKFADPETLWTACVEYFEWVADNPLLERKAWNASGVIVTEDLPKLRAMTIGGLCLFLDISEETWRCWKKPDSDHFRADLSGVIAQAEQVIYQQKFSGAAADLLNANIIARDLGLADKKEHTGEGGGPIKTESPSDMELARQIAFLLAKGISASE